MANYRVIYHDGMTDGESLSHHGILGMKWGVRRYQNPDGTLTEEGKRRYYTDSLGKYRRRNKEQLSEYDKRKSAEKKIENLKERQRGLDTWSSSNRDKEFDEEQTYLGWALFAKATGESADGYFNRPVSEGQKKIWPEYIRAAEYSGELHHGKLRKTATEKEKKEAVDKCKRLKRKICIQGLKDMGLEINEKNIEAMENIIFWD